jgi:hypothetical protein
MILSVMEKVTIIIKISPEQFGTKSNRYSYFYRTQSTVNILLVLKSRLEQSGINDVKRSDTTSLAFVIKR